MGRLAKPAPIVASASGTNDTQAHGRHQSGGMQLTLKRAHIMQFASNAAARQRPAVWTDDRRRRSERRRPGNKFGRRRQNTALGGGGGGPIRRIIKLRQRLAIIWPALSSRACRARQALKKLSCRAWRPASIMSAGQRRATGGPIKRNKMK